MAEIFWFVSLTHLLHAEIICTSLGLPDLVLRRRGRAMAFPLNFFARVSEPESDGLSPMAWAMPWHMLEMQFHKSSTHGNDHWMANIHCA
jgi:hypothetical protein